MLYAIRACRKLSDPFPMTTLKLRSGKPIDPGFQYSYAGLRGVAADRRDKPLPSSAARASNPHWHVITLPNRR
jgi:hypothetical protein